MKRPILDYYGGKFNLKKWIIENMPDHKIYVEPFGGGASVLLAKDPVKLEIYNDIDDEIVNVFNMAKFHGKELKRQLELTPYSRSIYIQSRRKSADPIDMAIKTITKSFMGIGDSIHNNSGFRNSKTSNSSPGKSFKNYVDYFDWFIERLRGVVIESLPYNKILEKYDSSETLFYLDPPYVFSCRSKKHTYGHELTDKEHQGLIDQITGMSGHVVLSGYENDIYEKLKWEKLTKEARTQKNKRTEALWIKPVA